VKLKRGIIPKVLLDRYLLEMHRDISKVPCSLNDLVLGIEESKRVSKDDPPRSERGE